MKFKITPIIVSLFFVLALNGQTKEVGECRLHFSIQQQQAGVWIPLGDKAVFIKGNQCKTVLTTAHLSQTLIFNQQEDTAVILKEIGETKFFQTVKYPPSNLPTLIAMKPLAVDSAIIIQGYLCKRIQVQWSDSSVYDIVYTTEIIPTVPNFETAFKDIPGLVMSYTITSNNGNIIKYQLEHIDLSPITLSQFEVNKSLYQIID